MTRTLLALAAPLLLVLPAFAQGERGFGKEPAPVPHREFAEAYLDARGLALDDDPEYVDVEELLRREFVRIDLGLYDLRFPIEDMAETESAANLREIVLALLGSQTLAHDWLEPGIGKQKTVRADIKTVTKWVEGWKPGNLNKGAQATTEDDRDLVKALAPKEKIVEALERFNAWMRSGGLVGLERDDPTAARILLMPTRPRFLQFVCFAGWLYPTLQEVFWTKGLGTWLGCRVQNTQVMALQFASPEISEGDFELGLPLNYKFPTVMQQHAVHFGTQALFDNYFGDAIPPFLSTGLALNTVLERFGEVDTRIEGDLRARFTEAFSAFVPGGNPSGGVLPAMNPDGRWRQEKGKEHFLELLKTAQREGGDYTKRPREKLIFFEIQDDDYAKKMGIRGPFLGAASDGKELPPSEFVGDYQEFYRAYKSAFCFWLQTAAGGSKKNCEKKFAQLLAGLGRAGDGGFEDLVREVYGKPLSEEEPSKDSLEGEFLIWLSKW